MLALGVYDEEQVFLTLTEDLPAGTTLVVMPIRRTEKHQYRIGFDAPRSVSITRESAKLKQPRGAA